MIVSMSGDFGAEIRLVRFLDCWNTSRMWLLLRRWLSWGLAVSGIFVGGRLAQPAVEN